MARRVLSGGMLAIGGVAMTVGVMASDLMVFAIGCGALIVSAIPRPPVAR